MVLKSNGNSEVGAHVRGNLYHLSEMSNLICSRLLNISKEVANLKLFSFRPVFLHTCACATCPKLPCNISTRVLIRTYMYFVRTYDNVHSHIHIARPDDINALLPASFMDNASLDI